MVINFDRQSFTPEEVISGKIQENCLSPSQIDVLKIVRKWFDDSETIEVTTSGSTGAPQPIHLKKEIIRYSAETSLQFLL